MEWTIRWGEVETVVSCCRLDGSDALSVQTDLGGIVVGEGRPRHDESPGNLVTCAVPGRDRGR